MNIFFFFHHLCLEVSVAAKNNDVHSYIDTEEWHLPTNIYPFMLSAILILKMHIHLGLRIHRKYLKAAGFSRVSHAQS